MKIYSYICSNWDKKQVQILRQYNIDVKEGWNGFCIYDLEIYLKLKPLLKKWELFGTVGTDFTKRERLSADYCVLDGWRTFGYPMPDGDMGYLYNTYDTTEMCDDCGVGIVQKDDFRAKRVPKYPVWGFIWIWDEIFVRVDLYEKVFKSLGIECRPLRRCRKGVPYESYVQLVIPVIDEALDMSFFGYEVCPKCGSIKYNALIRGYCPLQEHPLPYIYKSKELFGSGFSVQRKIFVSASLRDTMLENGMLKVRDFIPCVKTEELRAKNEGVLKWWKPEIEVGGTSHLNIVVAIPD